MKKIKELEKNENKAFSKLVEVLNEQIQITLLRAYITARHLKETEQIKNFYK